MSPDASWTISPGPIILLTGVLALYVVRWRRAGGSVNRLLLWVGGVVTVAAALISPIDALGEQLMTMHMVQHLLLLDIAPILFLLGLTRVILRPVTRRMLAIERRLGPLGHPVFAIVAYTGIMWVWHIPSLYEAALENPFVHLVEHASMSVCGGLYWWHVLSPIRSRHRLTGLGPVAYMFTTKIAVAVLGVFLTFAPESFYAFYEDQPNYWGLGAKSDQAVAGLIMAVEQSVVMGIAFGWIFVRMLSESDKEDERAERHAP